MIHAASDSFALQSHVPLDGSDRGLFFRSSLHEPAFPYAELPMHHLAEADVHIAQKSAPRNVHNVDYFDPSATELPGGSVNRTNSNKFQESMSARKRFIFRLVSALLSSGNWAYLTESYVVSTSRAIGLSASCGVFPSAVTLTFVNGTALEGNLAFTESYYLRVKSGINCYRLSLLDNLCYMIRKRHMSFEEADERLRLIEAMPPLYAWWVTALAHALAAMASTILFFKGDWRDGTYALLYGLLIYFVGVMTKYIQGLAQIQCFLCALLVSITASAFDRHVHNGQLCLYGQLFGGVVWLLPGASITVSIVELYSKMTVFGSSRLIAGIIECFQLGLGLVMGYKFIFPGEEELPQSFEDGCQYPVSEYFAFILLPVAIISFAVIIETHWQQLFGMVLAAAVAQFIASPFMGFQIIFASIGVVIVARVYAHFTHQRPLIYIIAGLLVLVPGGVGVRGMSEMFDGDVISGFEFAFNMILIAVCLAIGIFIGQLFSKQFFEGVFESLRESSSGSAGRNGSGAEGGDVEGASSGDKGDAESKGGLAEVASLSGSSTHRRSREGTARCFVEGSDMNKPLADYEDV
jgi:uncharacterized membrane protein YjjP (DUF1212 family)